MQVPTSANFAQNRFFQKHVFQIYRQNRLTIYKFKFHGADFAESDLKHLHYKATTLKTTKIDFFFQVGPCPCLLIVMPE